MSLAPFIIPGNGIHPVLDLHLLRQEYPSLPDDIWNITSASDLIGWEKLRDKYGIQDSRSVKCDLFVWGRGKSPDPRLTRIGGVPWLPKHVPWPEIDGVIPSFLCQFNFLDSRDLHGQRVSRKLPGDILLVFVADEDSAPCCEIDRMRFVWASAYEKEIVGQTDVPTPTNPFEFVQAWGARYRTQDVPSKWEAAYEIPKEELWALPVLWGTKIGGVPYDSQENIHESPKDFLCQITSVQASEDTSWPWVDRQDPISGYGFGGVHEAENFLMLGDMGELSIYLDDDEVISIESACG